MVNHSFISQNKMNIDRILLRWIGDMIAKKPYHVQYGHPLRVKIFNLLREHARDNIPGNDDRQSTALLFWMSSRNISQYICTPKPRHKKASKTHCFPHLKNSLLPFLSFLHPKKEAAAKKNLLQLHHQE